MVAANQKYVADLSLALLNRTGAYHVCKDIVRGCPQYFREIRYWRFTLRREPTGLARKALAHAMLFDLRHAALKGKLLNWRKPASKFTVNRLPNVFLDPLYVLNGQLDPRDIVLCHDIGPITHPKLFEPATVEMYQRAYAKIKARRPAVVCVSQATRREFVTQFGSAFRFLETIPLYVRSAIASGDAVAPAGISRPFILTVASTEARKNYQNTITAFAKTSLHRLGYSYVICGPRGNADREVCALAAATPGVVRLGFVPDSELRWLYANAKGFVLPSLLEGFGIPALEASQHGLVSLVSTGGAQEEAVGCGGLLVDPTSTDSIADGMMRLITMTQVERDRRLAQCRAHVERLSRDTFLNRWAEILERE